jgi:hypothetical protein
MLKSFAASFAVFALFSAPSVYARNVAQLPPAVSRAMSRTGVPASNVSILVRDAATSETIVELNAASWG